MKVQVVVVGGVRGALAQGVEEFEARAGRYWKLEVLEVASGVGGRGPVEAERVRAAEGKRLESRIGEGLRRWALTREGKGIDSLALARRLEEMAVQGEPGVAFLIGGAFGLSKELLATADQKLSLSRMTLPHELARLVLTEQLYRAGSILRNEPYHKGKR